MVRVLLLPDLGHVLGPGRVAVRHEAARGAHDVGQQLRHLAHVLLQGHVDTWPHNLGGEEVLPAAGEDVRGGVQAVAPHRGLHGPGVPVCE